MSVDDIELHAESVTVTFWGIKNDTNRRGFSVTVPKATDEFMEFMDICAVLKEYITIKYNRTTSKRSQKRKSTVSIP